MLRTQTGTIILTTTHLCLSRDPQRAANHGRIRSRSAKECFKHRSSLPETTMVAAGHDYEAIYIYKL